MGVMETMNREKIELEFLKKVRLRDATYLEGAYDAYRNNRFNSKRN